MINRALILNKLYCFDRTRARHLGPFATGIAIAWEMIEADVVR